MCFYLRNWQVTFLLYTLGVFISEYTAKAFTEPRDYRVVFLIQKYHQPNWLMVNRRYLQNKKLLGRRRLSCISFDPMGAWLQRILPPRTTSYLLYLKYIVFIPFCKGFLYF